MKTCRECGLSKIESDFNKAPTNKGGLYHLCRPCQSVRQKAIGESKRATSLAANASKNCNSCGIYKHVSEFPPTDTSGDGFRNTCRECQKFKQMSRYFANPGPVLAACREWRAKPGNKIRRSATDKKHRQSHAEQNILHRSRCLAKQSGVPHNLILEDIQIPSICPVLGIPLELNVGDTSKRPPGTPSIDRIVPELGYVQSNIRIISFQANRLKNNGTAEEHEAIAAYIRRETNNYPPAPSSPSHPEDDADRYP